MNCVLFATMDQVFKKNIKNYWKMVKHSGKVREFYQSGKVGTMEEYVINIWLIVCLIN